MPRLRPTPIALFQPSRAYLSFLSVSLRVTGVPLEAFACGFLRFDSPFPPRACNSNATKVLPSFLSSIYNFLSRLLNFARIVYRDISPLPVSCPFVNVWKKGKKRGKGEGDKMDGEGATRKAVESAAVVAFTSITQHRPHARRNTVCANRISILTAITFTPCPSAAITVLNQG